MIAKQCVTYINKRGNFVENTFLCNIIFVGIFLCLLFLSTQYALTYKVAYMRFQACYQGNNTKDYTIHVVM